MQVRFAEGESAVLNGATVMIGDNVCNTIDTANALPTGGSPMYVNVNCAACTDATSAPQDCLAFDAGLSGSEISIWKAGSGSMALCDVVVYKGERFPIEVPAIIG